MAGTADDNTTPADDWRLASAELVFVAKLVGSEERAKALLLDGAADGFIRWRCATLTVDEKRDFQANPPVETPLAAARLFFWHRDERSRIDVDRQISCAFRVGPVVRLGSDGMGNNWPIFDSRASSSWTASLVRFNHGDVVARLVALGLMPQPLVSQDNPESELASAAAVPAFATTTTKQRMGSQEQWLAPLALEIYGEDLPLLTPAELQHDIEARQKAKSLKTSLPPHWVPDWEACKRFLQKRGKLRPR